MNKRSNKIKLQRKLIKLRYYGITIPIFPIIALSFLFSIIFYKWNEWRDDQFQKVENLRVDLIYLQKYGTTYNEFYKDDNNIVDE